MFTLITHVSLQNFEYEVSFSVSKCIPVWQSLKEKYNSVIHTFLCGSFELEWYVLAKGLLKLLHLKVTPFIVAYSRCDFSPGLWHGGKLQYPHKTYKMKLLFFIHRLCRLCRPISFTKFTALLREGNKQNKKARVHFNTLCTKIKLTWICLSSKIALKSSSLFRLGLYADWLFTIWNFSQHWLLFDMDKKTHK